MLCLILLVLLLTRRSWWWGYRYYPTLTTMALALIHTRMELTLRTILTGGGDITGMVTDTAGAGKHESMRYLPELARAISASPSMRMIRHSESMWAPICS